MRFVEEAQAEVVHERRWYVRRAGERVADRFMAALEKAQIRVEARPETYALYAAEDPRLDGVRKCQLAGYPHKLIYELVEDEIIVYAVMHERRHPNYWKPRRRRETGA